MTTSRPVQRVDADRQWRLMVVSFGVSVAATRLSLQAAGYPQIGNDTLHIAHVLWGGLLLYAAVCVFLTFGNRWAYSVSAVIGGVGIGLFIDEVGKFITQTNDYFFPLAAPIIYSFFLLTTVLYLQVRRRRPQGVRAELYWALEQLKEIVDQDFDRNERARVEASLAQALTKPQSPEQRQVTEALLALVRVIPAIEPPRPNALQRLELFLRALEQRYVSRRVLKSLLVIAFLLSGVGGLAVILLLLLVAFNAQAQYEFLTELISDTFLHQPDSFAWLLIQGLLTGLTGLLYLSAGLLLLTRREVLGVRTGRMALVFELTVVNVLAFYFSQFAMLFSTLLALGILLTVERYRTRFLSVKP